MNNKEKILRYLSELMSVNERIEFEEELQNIPDLQLLKNEIESELNSLKKLNAIELNENYLTKLRINASERVFSKSFNSHKFSKYAVAASLILAIFIAVKVFNTEPSENLSVKDYNVQEYFSLVSDIDFNDFEENYFQQVEEYSIEEKVNFINRNETNNYEFYQTASELDDEIASAIEYKKIIKR